MKLKFIVVTLFSLFLAMQGYAQNSYNKAEVLEQITDLHPNLQNFIDQNFNSLTDREVQAYMNLSRETAVRNKYPTQFTALKSKATEAEMESLYRNFTEANARSLFTKYGIAH